MLDSVGQNGSRHGGENASAVSTIGQRDAKTVPRICNCICYVQNDDKTLLLQLTVMANNNTTFPGLDPHGWPKNVRYMHTTGLGLILAQREFETLDEVLIKLGNISLFLCCVLSFFSVCRRQCNCRRYCVQKRRADYQFREKLGGNACSNDGIETNGILKSLCDV